MHQRPDDVRQDMDKQHPAPGSPGGNGAQHIGFIQLQLRLRLDQLDHSQNEGDGQRHQHGGDAVAPDANEDNQVCQRRDGRHRVQQAAERQTFGGVCPSEP